MRGGKNLTKLDGAPFSIVAANDRQTGAQRHSAWKIHVTKRSIVLNPGEKRSVHNMRNVIRGGLGRTPSTDVTSSDA